MSDRSLPFLGSHAIITGGSSGIGKATARLLTQLGADVSIIARRPEVLEQAKAEIEEMRARPEQRVLALSADVSDADKITRSIVSASEKLGPVDLLVCSAGIAHPGYFDELPLEIFQRSIAVNYLGSLYAVKAAVEQMKPRRQGQIVLVSSGVGLLGIFGYSAYSPSKFALRGLAESLRGELKVLGIKISVAYPPDTDTPQLAQENETKPLETRRITGTAGVWSAEAVARSIVRGIRRNDFVIAPGLQMKLLARLHSLFGFAFNGYFDRIVEQSRRATGDPPTAP